MSRRLVTILLLAAVAGLAACCPRVVKIDTAIAAHGNTDWHVDTANEFLFGKDMAGNSTASNHCPDTWDRRHIHVDQASTSKYYYDPTRSTTGADGDATQGIDEAMLFFYAGHGNPEIWNTLGDNASQANVFVGNCGSTGGKLRYYWQCSCEVFAHGPRVCSGGGGEYACPADFDGSADSYEMRNVYERWAGALGTSLRMACGASTLAYCHEGNVNAIWDHYNNQGDGVADAFIDGLSSGNGVVPLCITKGGRDPAKSPLFDTVFTNAPNTAGDTFLHIQYLGGSASRFAKPLLELLPEQLPVLVLKPKRLPPPIEKRLQKDSGGPTLVSAVEPRLPSIVVTKASGAVLVRGLEAAPGGDPMGADRYAERARRLVDEFGLSEKSVTEAEVRPMMIDSVALGGLRAKPSRMQKHVNVSFRRTLEIGGKTVPTVGPGGLITVRLNNDGSLRHATKVWREVAGEVRVGRTRQKDEAVKMAMAKLADPGAYALANWTWGYKEADANVEQREMVPVFQFAFEPKDPKQLLLHPPRMVEIPALVE